MVKQKAKALASRAVHRTLVSVGSIGATLLLFFLLPVINKIAGGERADTLIIPVDTAEIPPPDVVEEEEDVEEEEPEEEEPQPELAEEAEPLDLAQQCLGALARARLERRAGLVEVLGEQLQVDGDRAERVLDLVREARGHRTHVLEAVTPPTCRHHQAGRPVRIARHP